MEQHLSGDQAANGGDWVSLDIHRFGGPGKEYVSLADVTFEPYLSTSIAFDAVKWVSRPAGSDCCTVHVTNTGLMAGSSSFVPQEMARW